MKKVPYAEWPESQVMLHCKHSSTVGNTASVCVCMKEGICNCLKYQKVLKADEIEEWYEFD